MRNLVLLLMLLLFISCKNESLIKGEWKYQEGYHVGDFLNLEENALVRNDTIFQDSNAVAKFIKVRVGYFGIPAKLHIANFETDEIGIYTAK